MRGRDSVSSWPGGLLSFAILFVILIYGALKLVMLVSRANPNVSTYLEQNFFDSSERMNLKERGVRFAFGIEGFLDKELKNDPRYVKTLFRLWGKREGQAYEKILPFHKCTAEDFDQFAPP
mmetsp:Transcript_31913/g.39629  ORF Transcript_31913/g.39629 Transcript_31913/m.39629 type:complete len:121 (-) Transcript_31913:819-1181(-)